MVIKFDEDKQNIKIAELREKESEDLAQYLSSKYGLPYIDLIGKAYIDTNALRIIREDDARQVKIAAFQLTNKNIKVAIISPNTQGLNVILENLQNQGYIPELYVCSQKSLEHAWSRYKDVSFATETSAGTLDVANEFISDFIKKVNSVDGAKKLIEDVKQMKRGFKISRIVEIIVAAGIGSKASDIHIEPEEDEVVVRFRIDGVLIRVTLLDFDTYKLLISRIKLLSGLKLNIKEQAQNGRFSVRIGETEFEIRTSTMPGNNGESVVMRLLDPKSLTVPLDQIGIPDKLLKLFIREIEKPNGMILNTGPTGSGKTTTLYSFLNRVKTPEIKIITIEDPIEYHLAGVVQTQVDQKKNYDFASGLKNSLRQDPDVIMVGEIRDNDTAATAIQAALTGHLVFSTLHTNSAAGAFPRLADLGVDSKIMTSAINLVIAQRLVRKLCPHCAKTVQLEGERLEKLKNIYDQINDPEKPPFSDEIKESVGCPQCNNTGYRGRIGIFEAIFMDTELEKIIHDFGSEHEIFDVAKKQGMISMSEDGLIKIMKGVTTIDEVERVVGFF
ncbi:MAG TPA: ATPase, T2SS/T4P/T4SS family [Candidatus Paceibacterota bacterium]|nr:ATPase, T2SS/T4P/T4SS family [Candidatus Paceibacterota bacterium]HMP18979.1 ATPase, T2SS/T4P/T4SS family [Candidatus Paceibacterota bacterium]HMP85409.1 ATPase, T2SS/T4P/T4SS family [Candidatus Paceibacterota bacterium]